MKVKIRPKIDESQRVILLLNEYQLTEDRAAKTYRFDVRVTDSNAVEIALDPATVAPGDYLVRLQVDGIESPLQADANGYNGPLVTVEAAPSKVVLRSEQIALEVKARNGNQVTVQGRVTVKNDKDKVVPNAQVFVKWTSPTGSASSQDGGTNNSGIATFTISGQSGVYKLEVENLKSETDYEFDRESSKLFETIDTRLNSLRCTNITLQIASEQVDQVTIRGIAKVIDETGNSVLNADVSIRWTLPDSSTESKTEKTDQNGEAVFTVEDGRGQYAIEITNIVKSGYAFDRAHSELSDSLNAAIKELRSTKIELSEEEEDEGRSVRINGVVTVQDQNGSPVQDANVSVRWNLADDTHQNLIVKTDNQGIARTFVTDGRGDYMLTIANITKEGYVFNSSQSHIKEKYTTISKALLSTNIDLSTEESGDTVTVNGEVTVEDDSEYRIPGVAVSVRWDLSDGTTQDQTVNTDDQGVANFSITNGKGSYTLTVTNIAKTGYFFDSDHSMLQESTVSPTNRLLSTKIEHSAKESGDTVTATGRVLIENEAGSPIKGAQVSIRWDLPDGSSQVQTAVTSGKGIATFSVSNRRGAYPFTITNIVKDGFTFDPANSVLRKRIVSPGGRIHSDHIELRGEVRADFAIMTCRIFVRDENDAPMADAMVSLTWTLPDGTAQTQTVTTNNSGVARSSISNGKGAYTVTITNISKDGYSFDPDASELSENINVY
jgi:protocatechuate 3,4-dioxygenase beta subunit